MAKNYSGPDDLTNYTGSNDFTNYAGSEVYTNYAGPYPAAGGTASYNYTQPGDYLINVFKYLPVNTKYLSNTTNGFAYNSFADVLLNKEAHKKRWGSEIYSSEQSTKDKYSRILKDTALLFKDTVVDPVLGSVEMAAESKTDDYHTWDALKAGLGTAAINTLINVGNTLDIISNPIKGAIIETYLWAKSNGEEGSPLAALIGFKRGLFGDEEYGRKQYDYSDYTDSGVLAFVLEFISDPTNLISLGSKAAVKFGPKTALTGLTDDAVETVVDVIGKGLTKDTAERIVREFSDETVQRAVKELGENVSEDAVKRVAKETGAQTAQYTRYLLNDGTDAVNAVMTALADKNYKNVTKETVEALLNYLTPEGVLDDTLLATLKNDVRSSVVSAARTLALNPESAQKLLGNITEVSKLRKFSGIPKLQNLPENIGEAIAKQLSDNRSLREAALKLIGKGTSPSVQKFAGQLVKDVTLDRLPGLARASKIYAGADFADALIRNTALQSAGLYVPLRFAGDGIKTLGGAISNAITHSKFVQNKLITNIADELMPQYKIDFSEVGNITPVTLTAPETLTKTTLYKWEALLPSLNAVRTNMLGAVTNMDIADINFSTIKAFYTSELERINKVITKLKSPHYSNFDELVAFVNKIDTKNPTILEFVKLVNELNERFTKGPTDKLLHDIRTMVSTYASDVVKNVPTSTSKQNIEAAHSIANRTKPSEIKKPSVINTLDMDDLEAVIDGASEIVDAFPDEVNETLLDNVNAYADLKNAVDEFYEVSEDYWTLYADAEIFAENAGLDLNELMCMDDLDDIDALYAKSAEELDYELDVLKTTVEELKTDQDVAEALYAKSAEELDYELDVFKTTVKELKTAEEELAVVAQDVVEAYMYTQELRMDILDKSYIPSFANVDKAIDAVLKKSIVKIDDVVNYNLVAYRLGVSKRDVLRNITEGIHDKGFVELLDDYEYGKGTRTLNALLTELEKKSAPLTEFENNSLIKLKEKSSPLTELENNSLIKLKEKSLTATRLEVLHDSVIRTRETLDKLVAYRKLNHSLTELFKGYPDTMFIDCILDELINILQARNGLSVYNLESSVREMFDKAIVKRSAYTDMPKLSQDFYIRQFIKDNQHLKGNAVFDTLSETIEHSHDAMNDINNLMDTFLTLKADPVVLDKVAAYTENGTKALLGFDLEATGLAEHATTEIYQIGCRLQTETETIKKLYRIRVSDIPDDTVLQKLFNSTSLAERQALQDAFPDETLTARSWFEHTYMLNDNPFYTDKLLDPTDAFNLFYKEMIEPYNPVLFGQNIKGYDIKLLKDKAPLCDFLNSAVIIDTYETMQGKHLFLPAPDVREGLEQAVRTVIRQSNYADTFAGKPIFIYSDLQNLSDLKYQINELFRLPEDSVIPNAYQDVLDRLDKGIETAIETWKMKPSYLQQQQDVFVVSKAGLGLDELAQLYAEGITDTEHGESIMDLLFKHTSTKDIAWFNPQTVYSFEFANYFSPDLIKAINSDLYGDGYAPAALLANLTKQTRSMNKLKKGFNNTLVEYYYRTAYDILKFAKVNASVYDVPYLKYVDLDRLSKANTVALLLTYYNHIVEFYKQYKRANSRFKIVKVVPKLDDLGNPIMRQVIEGLDRTYTERTVIPTGSWKKVKRTVPTKVVTTDIYNYNSQKHVFKTPAVEEHFPGTTTEYFYNTYTRRPKQYKRNKFIPRHVEYDSVWVPGEDVVREAVINPPKVREVATYDIVRVPTNVVYPEVYTKLDVFENLGKLYKAEDYIKFSEHAVLNKVPSDRASKYTLDKFQKEADAIAKIKNLATIDSDGNFMDIYTGKFGSYSDISDYIKAAKEEGLSTVKALLKYNQDRHLCTAAEEATASLYRTVASHTDEFVTWFKELPVKKQEAVLSQMQTIEQAFSNEAVSQFLQGGPEKFIREAMKDGGRKTFETIKPLSDESLKAFKEAGIIIKEVPQYSDGTEALTGYLYLFTVPVNKFQGVFELKHALDPAVLKSLEDAEIKVQVVEEIIDDTTVYRYILNDGSDLIHSSLTAKGIADIEGLKEKLVDGLSEHYNKTKARLDFILEDMDYSNGSVQTEDMFIKFEDYFEGASGGMPIETLKALGYFDKLRANNLVYGVQKTQALFNPYACSDFIRRHAYTEISYIEQQQGSVTSLLNFLFNNENGLQTSEWLKDISNTDLYDMLKNNKDMSLLYVRPSRNTKSGYVVNMLTVTSPKAIQLAKDLNAHLVPTNEVYSIMKAVNTFEVKGIFKVAQNISKLYKLGYLSSIGWLMRNLVDSTYKNHLDMQATSSIPEQLGGFFNAVKLVMQYNGLIQGIGRNFDNALEYETLYHICKGSETEWLLKAPSAKRYVKRFSSISDTTKKELTKQLIEPKLFEFVDLFVKHGPSAGMSSAFKNALPSDGSAIDKLSNYYTKKLGFIFNTNEYIEQAARLHSYLYALQRGASLDEATARVLKTHFDYSDKSLAMWYTEMVFPFMSFSFKNMSYWIETLMNNGRTAGALENILRSILDYQSLFNPDYEVYRNYDYSFDFEEDVKNFGPNQPWQLINAARLYHMLSGNIVWDTGKDVTRVVDYGDGPEEQITDLFAVFKLSPSFMDAVNMLYTPLNQFEQRMLPPYKILYETVNRALSGEDINLAEELSIDGFLNKLPFIGAILQRTGVNLTGDHATNNMFKRIKDDGMRQILTSLFTAAYVPHKEYNTWYGENDEYLTKLPNKSSKKKYPKNTYYKKYYSKGYSRTPYTRSRYYRSSYNKTFSRQGGFTVNYSTARRYQSLYGLETPRYKLDMLSRSPYYKDNYQKSKKQVLRTTQYSSLTYNMLKDNILKKRILDKYFYYT